MAMHIVPFQDRHVPDAAHLVATRYRGLRGSVATMPEQYMWQAANLRLISSIPRTAPSAVAIASGRLVGFLGGYVIPEFEGHRTFYSPEWANGALLDGGRRTVEDLYAHVSPLWVSNGCRTHLVTILANDCGGIEAWQWLGFGLRSVDAVRTMDPLSGPGPRVQVQRAGHSDIEVAVALSEGLARHLAGPPAFVLDVDRRDAQFFEEWLAHTSNALWLAYERGRAIGCLASGPASEDACAIIDDPGTMSIIAAFTEERARGRGVCTALLNQALEWGRSRGYVRCAVDFEPMNAVAARFWMRRFTPVCYSLVRRLA